MNRNFKVINGSRIVSFFIYLNSAWENSKIYKFSLETTKCIDSAAKTSFIVKWFLTKKHTFSKIISESFIYNALTKLIFDVTRFFVNAFVLLTKNSYSKDLSKSIKKDLKENGISVVSSVLFSFLVTYLLLELFFGDGFSRQVALSMFLICVALFVFSFFMVSPARVLRESRLWKWLREIFQ